MRYSPELAKYAAELLIKKVVDGMHSNDEKQTKIDKILVWADKHAEDSKDEDK